MPSIHERTLLGYAERAEIVRRKSLVSKIDRVSESVAKLTGTEIGRENPLKLTAFIGLFIAASVAAEQIPDHQLAFFVSSAVGALGGAFAGDNLRPISRFGRFNSEKFAKKIQGGEAISDDEMIDFLATFPDVITENQIRRRVLYPSKTPDNGQQLIVDVVKDRIGFDQIDGKDKTPRRRAMADIKSEINSLQTASRERRNNKANLRHEGRQRAGDIGVGVGVVGLSVVLLNLINHNSPNAAIGAFDDLIIALMMIGSFALKEAETNPSFKRKTGELSTPISHHVNPLARDTHRDGRDGREAVRRTKSGIYKR